MFYREIAPKGDLNKIIECFWMLEHDYRAEFHSHEHLWADVRSELIFTFGKPYYQKARTDREELPRSFVIGPFKKKLILYSDGFTGFVAVRFKPWGLSLFSLKPIPELVGTIVPAEDIFGPQINSLVRRFRGREREEKIELMQHYFLQQLSAAARNAKMASVPIVEKIIAERGIVAISALLKQFRINSRRLERILRAETGLSPKMFSRITRFNHAKRMIEENPEINLGQLTYESGYSDQAHFNKNFRELFDRSPADFKRKLKRFAKEASGKINVEFLQDHSP